MVIFTKEIAEELIARGYELEARTSKAWIFKESVLLERAVSKLVEALQEVDR